MPVRNPRARSMTDKVDRVPFPIIFSIVLFGSVGPLATDMYLPAFPQVMADLRTSHALLNVTLTTFFAGMAVGQLFGGRFSDQVGRKPPLIAGTIGLLIASAACAMAPNIAVLIVARLLQGATAGWAMVIGRAILVDLTQGATLVRYMNLIMAIGGVAPLVAPLLGAVILKFSSWHFSFWAITAIAALQVYCAAFVVPETLPPERRHSGGVTEFGRAAVQLLRRRAYVGYMMINACQMVAIFAYVSSSPYFLQTLNGLSPTQFSLIFSVNATFIILASTISAKLAGRISTTRTIASGIAIYITSGLLLLAGAAWFGSPLWMVWTAFAILCFSNGLVMGNAGALAAAQAPEHAGTASALLGLTQSAGASIGPVLLSALGANSPWPPSMVITVAGTFAMAMLFLVALPADRRAAEQREAIQ